MTTICAFGVALDRRARAAPIRYLGSVNLGPNLSGCTNRWPDLTHSVGPRLDWRAPGLLGPLPAAVRIACDINRPIESLVSAASSTDLTVFLLGVEYTPPTGRGSRRDGRKGEERERKGCILPQYG
ncbi:hypothetical protein FN846DRAFT_896308 [Sphaerosporella brunnea]|uniref:Uncharacterized protein n=1 Tax=Sphaerosporella brunnea TaxID=1250544 RepID=A0A5J5ECV3_9PEZI|nr:hypothetical protein FN846DRAFT_896308 [Sphaerosporella brunnea]